MDIQPVRGTRDFFPEDMRIRNWLFAHFRETARLFNFEEYDAPVLETEELYIRKAGEEITEQLYNFEDKSGRRVALRPEMTPSLARMILQKKHSLSVPVKWFSIPQCWRYERMSRGRKREHYQWNVDIFGVPGVTAETELMAVLVTFFQRVGLSSEDVQIRFSSRKVIQSVLEKLGITADRFAPVCILVDKLEKVPREAIEGDMKALGLTHDVIDQIIEVLSAREISQVQKFLGDDHPVINELQEVVRLADAYGFRDWLVFDASIVRGLAYYTGIVFEAFDRGATLRAVCGGGRYDRLLSTFGGKDMPACGFGFGDVVILELLKEKGLVPELAPAVDALVFPFEASLRGPAMELARQLRAEGRSVELVLEEKKPKWVFKQADRLGARKVVLIAPDEWQKGLVRVKDLSTGEEHDITPAGVISGW